MDDTAVEDEQLAAARIVRCAADIVPALPAAHKYNLDQIIVRMHHARMGGGFFVRTADRKQARRLRQTEWSLILFFDKALDHARKPPGFLR